MHDLDKVLIVGFGDVGHRLAELYRKRRVDVSALTRRGGIPAPGLCLIRGDLDRPETLAALPSDGATVFYLAPPPGEGEDDPRVQHFLGVVESAPPARIIYISTSGVYGDRGGAWVDEQSEPRPDTDRARRRLAAELALRAFGERHGIPVVVLRVGGIYGPGRLPLSRLRRGLPVLREAECGYTNRIHVDDLVATLVAAAERDGAGGVYNVSDGRPGTMTGYFKALAARLGLPPPPEVSLAEAHQRLSPAMLSYLTESRRLDNRRMCRELGIALQFPDLEAGLASLDPATELARPESR